MNVSSRRSGFSLVELLTVIAIIAILAAIIFPVMTAVKERARQNQCMTNLHQIAMAVQMFKQDNRRYPEILGSEVRPSPSNPDMFENVKDRYLFPEYVKTIAAFHCPSSRISDSREMMSYVLPTRPRSENPVYLYAYDSYDAHVVGFAATGNPKLYTNVEPHYLLKWAESPEDILSGGLETYPPGVPNDEKAAQQDYERQLRFRTPPGDTVVTWCSYHETREGGNVTGGKALVVFLDGHADSYPAQEMEQRKWRVRPKRS